MGNCQAAEAATVVIQHPGNKIERIYWSVSANEIMTSNPDHYVAMVVTSLTLKNDNCTPLKQLKLLRPGDTLLIGHVYRLISFEDVWKAFAAKKCVKLEKLLKDRGGIGLELKKKDSSAPNPKPNNPKSDNCSPVKVEHEGHRIGSNGNRYLRRHHVGGGGGQWKPALQSIAEFGA